MGSTLVALPVKLPRADQLQPGLIMLGHRCLNSAVSEANPLE